MPMHSCASMVIVTIKWSLHWHTQNSHAYAVWGIYTQSYASSFLLLLLLIALYVCFLCCSTTVTWHACTLYTRYRQTMQLFAAAAVIVAAPSIHSWAWPFFCIFNFKYHQLHIYVYSERCEFSQFLATNLAHICENFIEAGKKRNGDKCTQTERGRDSTMLFGFTFSRSISPIFFNFNCFHQHQKRRQCTTAIIVDLYQTVCCRLRFCCGSHASFFIREK